MERLSEILIRLLRDGDFVALPGIGTLMAERVSGRLDKVRSVLFPPRKTLAFNPSIIRNDGLLINAIAELENCNLTEGQKIWDSWKSELNIHLEKFGSYEFKGLGTLMHVGSTYSFQADEFGENLLKESFGLQPILVHPISHQITAPPSKVVALPRRQIIPWRKLAAAALFIPFGFYLFWLFTHTEILHSDGQFQMSDLHPFAVKICSKYKPADRQYGIRITTDETKGLISTDTSEIIRVNFLTTEKNGSSGMWIRMRQNFALADTTQVQMPVVKIIQSMITPGSYHIVMGCFSVSENALRYAEELKSKGYQAVILDTFKTLHRVAITGFVTRESALENLENIKTDEQPGAWLVRK